MTKAIICTACNQVVGPRSNGSKQWNFCSPPCMHSGVRWRDPQKGHLEVTSLHGPHGVLIIGLHNGMLHTAMSRHTDEQWREIHTDLTKAPGYLFDESKRACWAVALKVGDSNDVWFEPYQPAWDQYYRDIHEQDARAQGYVTEVVREWAKVESSQAEPDWGRLEAVLATFDLRPQAPADGPPKETEESDEQA